MVLENRVMKCMFGCGREKVTE